MNLDKTWLRNKIPHIAEVIADVKDNEGVEITINCNVQSFDIILKFLTDEEITLDEEGNELDPDLRTEEKILQTINIENCLNMLVSVNFLGLKDLYEKIWAVYFRHYFVEIINKC